ncbi:hypothetical protein BLOT_014559 [Blomia tropicalis]|nr:hypothetical protein BLOT_014559 [Blomia tropicalis]
MFSSKPRIHCLLSKLLHQSEENGEGDTIVNDLQTHDICLSIHYRIIGFGWCTRNKITKLYNLPDKVLMKIIEQLSLQEVLFSQRFACTRWNLLVKSICKQKTKLKLIFVDTEESQNDNSNKNNSENIETLIFCKRIYFNFPILFPNIKHLVLCNISLIQFNISQLVHLTSLTITIKEYDSDLWKSINSISTLQSLTICFEEQTTEDPNLHLNLSNILPNLNQLTLINYYHSIAFILKSLNHCQHLSLIPMAMDSQTRLSDLKQTIIKNKNLIKNLKTITLTNDPKRPELKIPQEIPLLLCTKLTSIQKLDVPELVITTDMIKAIKKSTLSHLLVDNIDFERKYVQTKSYSQSYQIRSIRELTLRNQVSVFEMKTFVRIIGSLFPNLEQFELKSNLKHSELRNHNEEQCNLFQEIKNYQKTITNYKSPKSLMNFARII